MLVFTLSRSSEHRGLIAKVLLLLKDQTSSRKAKREVTTTLVTQSS